MGSVRKPSSALCQECFLINAAPLGILGHFVLRHFIKVCCIIKARNKFDQKRVDGEEWEGQGTLSLTKNKSADN